MGQVLEDLKGDRDGGGAYGVGCATRREAQNRLVPSENTKDLQVDNQRTAHISSTQVRPAIIMTLVYQKGIQGTLCDPEMQPVPPPFCGSPMVRAGPDWAKQTRAFSSACPQAWFKSGDN